ncbi:citrate synthase family protein [Ideonella sp. A 288]|uniref:citrate synthase family protein n=1 Tax=Ideonella sp. A 288 TaxID=1962181 RepID=UPI0028739FB0|nr:citrate synthase family protein [Ideonella sp. A 288]
MASMSRLKKDATGTVNLDRADQSEWLDAAAAAARLGVSRNTLYAYVSRGRLASHPAPGSTARRYRAADVAALAQRHAGAHTPSAAARATLDWGLPVMTSALTLIERGRFCYRGHDVLALADAATLEDVAALLWADAPAEAWALVRARARQACGARARAGEPLHAQLARGWGLDPAGAALLRRALVLSADHELNASSFTVRCVASTGATLEACLGAGQAALSGPRHGGMTMRVEALWTQWQQSTRLEASVRRWIDDVRRTLATRGGTPPAGALPGFGHPLYPKGDPRARQLLACMPLDASRERVIATVREAIGLEPALDFALVALRRSLGLPEGAAFEIFAVARSVGWIAHALEQRQAGALIRPRAHYTGPRPQAAPRGRVVRVR